MLGTSCYMMLSIISVWVANKSTRIMFDAPHVSFFFLQIFRWFPSLLVRTNIRKYLVVQRWRWKRKEIHVATRWLEIARYRTGIHVTTPHICTIQSRWPQCLQSEYLLECRFFDYMMMYIFLGISGLQTTGIVMRKCWRSRLMESFIPSSWCLSRER